MRAVLVLLVVALCSAVGGCGGHPPAKPDYVPIPDQRLYARVADLPGVVSVHIAYHRTFETGSGYVGDVRLRKDSDPLAALDATLAILRQGRWQASMTIEVRQPGRTTSTDQLGLPAPTDENLTKRYGRQPGDGRPPASGA